jgi:hypothetical protein
MKHGYGSGWNHRGTEGTEKEEWEWTPSVMSHRSWFVSL